MKDYYRCNECGGPCGLVEETFDYSGTHCNNGISGTHHTGIWVSDCCLSEYHESELEKPQNPGRNWGLGD